MQQQDLLPHLFRTEYRKIVSVLCKLFGIEFIEEAEDVVSDTFLLAAETWGLKGLPKNPTAWLYTVSKNKTIDHLRRHKILLQKIEPELRLTSENVTETQIDLSAKNINDSQLQMMFAICHPCITTEAQIGLSLNILCGFGAEEIADAFLSTKESIYKRLNRAKEKLRAEQVKIEMPSATEIPQRLETVLTTIYLLFSEGYYSTSKNNLLRQELCLEAMRLNYLLLDYPETNTPSANALLSLMCFHASRFEARIGQQGEIVLYEEQDESRWNQDLIRKGEYYLNQASTGRQVTRFHLEAAIGYWHTQKSDTHDKWENILQLYNRLLQLEYSPIAALNRTYALSKANGAQEAIIEAEKLNLKNDHLYHMLLGTLYEGIDKSKSKLHIEEALRLAKTSSDKNLIEAKLRML